MCAISSMSVKTFISLLFKTIASHVVITYNESMEEEEMMMMPEIKEKPGFLVTLFLCTYVHKTS